MRRHLPRRRSSRRLRRRTAGRTWRSANLVGDRDNAMTIHRRDFLTTSSAMLLAAPALIRSARATETPSLYDLERFGNARILHLTDTHAQLRPVYFGERSGNRGV